MTQRCTYPLLILLSLICTHSASLAEFSVLSGVDRDTVSVGDLITFRLRVLRAPEDRVEILPGVGFPGVFEIRGQQEPVIQKDKAQVKETRDYVLAVYQTGRFEIPPLVVEAVSGAGDTTRIPTDPVPIVVRSVMPEGLSDILDIKPPVEVEARVPWWVWVASVGFLGIVVGIVWVLRRKRRKPVTVLPPPPVDWRVEVEKIARMGLMEKGDYKQFYTLLSELFRRYLEAEVGIEAMERTTREIATDMNKGSISDATITATRAFLLDADLVKFAKFRPPEKVVRAASEQVLELIQRLESTPTPAAQEKISTTGTSG